MQILIHTVLEAPSKCSHHAGRVSWRTFGGRWGVGMLARWNRQADPPPMCYASSSQEASSMRQETLDAHQRETGIGGRRSLELGP